MDYRMVVDSELLELSVPDRYFSYAEAYGSAAKSTTEKMCTDESESKWANAAVALMLSAHAVELFLKGAIFNDNPSAKVGHHNIEELYEVYCQIYTFEEFFFDMPFKTEYLGMTDEEVEALKKSRPPTPSVLYRYPTATGNKEWVGAYGFEASSFIPVLEQLLNDFGRLRKCIT